MLAVSTSGAPQSVHGTDGREHVEYDLVVTNSFNTDVVPISLVVRGGGRTLLELNDDALHNATQFLGGGRPDGQHPGVVDRRDVRGRRDAARGRAERAEAPSEPHQLYAASGHSAPIVGSTTVRAPELRVPPPAPIEIAPPLRGAGWLSANACCDPLLEHRSLHLPVERHLCDRRDVRRRLHPPLRRPLSTRATAPRTPTGSATEPRSTPWRPEGWSPAFDDRRTSPRSSSPIPPCTAPSQFGGSNVVIEDAPRRVRPLRPPAARFDPASRSAIACGRVRSSACSATAATHREPHLHFAITDGRNPLSSNSLPFEIDRFRFEGTAAIGPAPGAAHAVGHATRAAPRAPARPVGERLLALKRWASSLD